MISHRENYNKNGYTIFRQCLSTSEIEKIDRHASRIFQDWSTENKAEIFDKKLVNMHSLTHPQYFHSSPEQRIDFFNAISTLALTEAIEGLFGSNNYFHNTQLFFNPTNKKRQPYWHRDLQFSPIQDEIQKKEQKNMLSLHVRIPFVAEQGVEIVKGTHKRWDTNIERDVRFERNHYKNSDDLPNTELISLAPGDVLVFDAQMIHRGNYARNPTRKALDLCVGKYHPLPGRYLDPLVLPNKQEINQITNNQWFILAHKIIKNRA